MRGGAAGGFFEEARVALKEENVEDEVEGEGAEVKECGEKAPVLDGNGQHAMLIQAIYGNGDGEYVTGVE